MLMNLGALPVRMSRASLSSFPTAMHASDDRGDRSPKQLEAAARAEMELRANRTFTDVEWTAIRARLLEFAGILRSWDRQATASRRGNVEVLCQPGP